MDLKVLAISYGRNLFVEDNADHKRQLACAKTVAELHMVVFTTADSGLKSTKIGNLYLYPTNSRNKLMMLYDAVFLGRRLLKDESGTWVITTQDPFEAGLVGLILKWFTGAPLNVQEHGDFFSHPGWSKEKLMNRCRVLIARGVFRYADSIRVVSKRIKNTIVEKFKPKVSIHVLPVAVDVSAFMSSRLTDSKVGEVPVVLTAARLVPQKNLSLLLQAWSLVKQSKVEANLVIVGEGTEKSTLVKLADGLSISDSVTFKPWQSSLLPELKSADIYVLSSNYEGWGRVLIEAMAVGLPIVSTEVGAVGEVVLPGQHGYFVPIGDSNALAEALIKLIKDRDQRSLFGRAGIETAKTLSDKNSSYPDDWSKVLIATKSPL